MKFFDWTVHIALVLAGVLLANTALAASCAPAQPGTYLKSSKVMADGQASCEYAPLPQAAAPIGSVVARQVAPDRFWCPDGTAYSPRWQQCAPAVQYGYAVPAYPPGYGARIFFHELRRLTHRHHSRHQHWHGGGYGRYDPRNPCGGRVSRC